MAGAFAASVACNLLSKVAECLVAPVGRQCGYVIFYYSYFRELQDELERLDYLRQRVQRSIDEARNNMKPIRAIVERWATNVETVASKAREMLEDEGRNKKTCVYGWLPNPKARYRLSREASRTVKDIQALIARGQFEKVDLDDPPGLVGGAPPGLVGGPPDVYSFAGDGGDTITDSRASIFQDIMKALNDEKLKVIGVYGPGGVGKTTLLMEVEKKLREEGRPFGKIVNAEVLQTPDLNNIQDQIADYLSLNLTDMQSHQGRRDLLFQRLQRDPSEKVLIILDDLWDGLDLRAVGIPSGDERTGCQVLLTSRFKDVLEQKMLADRIFRLEGLTADEAFGLFEKIVGDRLRDQELKEIAAKVVPKLAGLPLLITSVARTLKYSDVSTWRNALIKIDDPNMETIVRLSYDHLESEETKSLFLLCSLIGGTIQVKTLLELGLGLGLFEAFDNTIESSRNRLNTMLDSLRSTSLLQDDGDDEENVTVNDLYSEVVVSTSLRGQNSLMTNNNYGSWPKEKLDKCWAIYLANVGSDMLAKLMWCEFPELKILMLSQSKDWLGSPAHQYDVKDFCRLDFTYMKELQVLYLRNMHITTLPSSIEILRKLQSLHLESCDMEDVAILGKLKALKILSFAGSAICRLPKDIGELTHLRSLNLSNCNMLQIIEPSVLKGLINLEELHMKGSFDQWMGKYEISPELCNVRLTELKSLKKIASLEIWIRDPTTLLEDDDLPFENLYKFWISIGNVEGREFEGLRTMKLKLEECGDILLREWVQKTLHKTQYLYLDGLRESKNNADELCTQGSGQLKHLDITLLDQKRELEVLCLRSMHITTLSFLIETTKLQKLYLDNCIVEDVASLGKLKALQTLSFVGSAIYRLPKEIGELTNLRSLNLSNCNMLQIIEPGVLKGLINLKELHMKGSFDRWMGKDEISSELCNARLIELKSLTKIASLEISIYDPTILLEDDDLPFENLIRFWINVGNVEGRTFEGLRTMKLKLEGCDNILSREWVQKTLHKTQHLHLEGLRESKKNAHELCIKGFGQLKHLDIINSPSIKYIANSSKGLPLATFPILESLFLENLINMEEICQGPIALECFNKLKAMSVKKCDQLKNLWFLSEAQKFVQLEEIQVSECESMPAIIPDEAAEVEVHANEIVELPNTSSLKLGKLPNMTSFCTKAEVTSEGAPIQGV
ncbi:disease resistance protein At4g27190 [Eucalyptus grandis]|uniref:disease resistance protein At4g27190 n=1 Tax=Eucalyptus grandis TaxID=71139 RepID=UPI00192EEA9C|nr:disease resistance protein At4g27190 [Eucalyptus grandis]